MKMLVTRAVVVGVVISVALQVYLEIVTRNFDISDKSLKITTVSFVILVSILAFPPLASFMRAFSISMLSWIIVAFCLTLNAFTIHRGLAKDSVVQVKDVVEVFSLYWVALGVPASSLVAAVAKVRSALFTHTQSTKAS